MTRTSKALLAGTVLCVIAGFLFNTDLINIPNLSWLYVALPLGAVGFGLFMISKVLEKEMARYDQEHAHAVIPSPVAGTRQSSSGSPRPSATQRRAGAGAHS